MEILAPAGNMDALKAAVACGANAVYLGMKNFNARDKAENFSEKELCLAVSYCHERNVRVYVTFNTLVKSKELKSAVEAVGRAAAAGADAFLIQDLGFYSVLRRTYPQISFHASTQLGVHNAYGAKFAERLGFDRVVLSREVLPEDLEAIRAQTSVETEVFVHGAHCISFSGNCYFSSLVSGYSGNRGKCLQFCRKKYRLSDGKKEKRGFLLSAKDICLLSELPRLRKLGVSSLKIEGRLRSKEYAGVVLDVYRRALDGQGKSSDITSLKTVFNRGDYSCAYLNGDRPDIVDPSHQNHIGVRVATVASVKGNIILASGGYCVKEGDGYKLMRGGREIGGASVAGGRLISQVKPAVGDEIRLTKSADLSAFVERKIVNNVAATESNYKGICTNNRNIMSDIVANPYGLPHSCRILSVNENTEEKLYGFADLLIFSPLEYSAENVRRFREKTKLPFLLDMPIEARGKDLPILEKIVEENRADGYVVNNIYALELCRNRPVILGAGMNVLSDLLDVPKIMSYEAAEAENRAVLPVFGRIPLMNLTHCPRRQLGYRCGVCENCGRLTLTDEQNNRFLLRRHREHYCYFELLNGKITNLLPKLAKQPADRILFDVRDVDPAYALAVLRAPEAAVFDERINTYGRFGKGVK